jgi:hypothetical protein
VRRTAPGTLVDLTGQAGDGMTDAAAIAERFASPEFLGRRKQ